MLYKTITLELLQKHERPTTIPLLDRYSALLRDRHERWLNDLSRQRPNSDPTQLSGEAMELAVRDLEEQLRTDFPQEENDTLSLEAAMRYARRHTPPA